MQCEQFYQNWTTDGLMAGYGKVPPPLLVKKSDWPALNVKLLFPKLSLGSYPDGHVKCISWINNKHPICHIRLLEDTNTKYNKYKYKTKR